MYRCEECGAVFAEPRRCYGEMLEHFGFPCHETLLTCPSCGGDSFEEVVQCERCGVWLPDYEMEPWEDDANEDSGFLCEDCAVFLAAVAALESGWGKSNIAEKKHNLFGWGGASGYMEFESKESCISHVAQRLKALYLTPDGKYFHGFDVADVNVCYNANETWGVKVEEIMDNILGRSAKNGEIYAY